MAAEQKSKVIYRKQDMGITMYEKEIVTLHQVNSV